MAVIAPDRTRKGEYIVDRTGRRRLRGQLRRGRMTEDMTNALDVRLAVQELQGAHELLTRADDTKYTPIEREANRREAHAKIGLASRLVDDIVLRRKP